MAPPGPPALHQRVRPTRAFAELARRRRARHPLAILTDHQLAVALLVAEGLDNAQIGRCLWVTRRTVEFHLTNIYRALGVTTRLQLAALIAAGGHPIGVRTPETTRAGRPRDPGSPARPSRPRPPRPPATAPGS